MLSPPLRVAPSGDLQSTYQDQDQDQVNMVEKIAPQLRETSFCFLFCFSLASAVCRRSTKRQTHSRLIFFCEAPRVGRDKKFQATVDGLPFFYTDPHISENQNGSPSYLTGGFRTRQTEVFSDNSQFSQTNPTSGKNCQQLVVTCRDWNRGFRESDIPGRRYSQCEMCRTTD